MIDRNRLRVVYLNTWAGMGGLGSLLMFFQAHQDVDVFCLQEVYQADGTIEVPDVAAGRSLRRVEKQLFQILRDALSGYTPFFTSQVDHLLGIVTFVKSSIRIIERGERCVYREPGYMSAQDIADHARMMQYVTVELSDGSLASIFNTHGAWQLQGKGDTPDRLDQSRRMILFADGFRHPVIMGGDLNLALNTQSIRSFEEAGWENLIRSHQISSTRTRFYDKPERHADYIFIKNGVRVKTFLVLPEEVSDHAALYLDCII